MDFISAPQNASARRCNLSVVALAPLLASPRRSTTCIVWRTRVRQPVNSGSLTADPPKPRTILDPGSPRFREDRGARNARVHVSARHSNSRYSNLQVSRRSNEHATREKGTVSSFKFLPRVVICGEASLRRQRAREREDRLCLLGQYRDSCFDGFHPRGEARRYEERFD